MIHMIRLRNGTSKVMQRLHFFCRYPLFTECRTRIGSIWEYQDSTGTAQQFVTVFGKYMQLKFDVEHATVAVYCCRIHPHTNQITMLSVRVGKIAWSYVHSDCTNERTYHIFYFINIDSESYTFVGYTNTLEY